jgi:hypothetical protein
MGRFIALLYGLASYVVCLVTFLYAIGVVSGLVGDLLFAAVTTTSIVVSILLEEHDLVDLYCGEYRHYKNYLSMLVLKAAQQHARPRWRGRKLIIFKTPEPNFIFQKIRESQRRIRGQTARPSSRGG